jgi:phosphohistidine phosphatase
MKKLIVVRHAKSSWATMGMDDFDRPLNERGKKDAPQMAKRLIQKHIEIDAFISSTANRAFTTALYFAEAYGKNQHDILAIPTLYHAAPQTFYTVVESLANDLNTVILFSHNPGITDFVNQLTNTRIDNMPTCGIFAVSVETNSWQHFATAKKTYWFFDSPKLR